MASEYLKWKYRDVTPDKPVELTPAEKRRNWWHYHKWYVALAVLLVCIGGSLLKSAFHLGEVLPDCQIAYVGTAPLPADAVSALEQALSAYAEDVNGDGRCLVRIHQYPFGDGTDDSVQYAYASSVTLMADLEDCQSGLFLLENWEQFQQDYAILRLLDGSLPEDNLTRSPAPAALSWSACPVLTGLDLGAYNETVAGQAVTGDVQSLLSSLFIARRGAWDARQEEKLAGIDHLWAVLTEGGIGH